MNPKKVILVDCSAVCYAAFYSTGHLQKRGEPTGVLYGFWKRIQAMCKATGAVHLVFCWDSKQSMRKRIYPEYKANRKQKDSKLEQAYEQFNYLRDELIPKLGFTNSLLATGYEADDIIASICRFNASKEDNVQYSIMSSDADLYQLLTENVSMWHLSKKMMYTMQDFQDEYKITPIMWSNVKAIAGCSSDNIRGIVGIGEKKAIKFLLDEKSMPIIHEPENKRIILRNQKLVTLPFKGTPKFTLQWDKLPSYTEWLTFCDEQGFTSFIQQSEEWESIFTGIPIKNNLKNRLRF